MRKRGDRRVDYEEESERLEKREEGSQVKRCTNVIQGRRATQVER